MQHHRHVVLARRGECTPNAAGQLLLEFKGRIGQAEAQNPGLAVALHADPLGQFPCFLRGTPEDEVFRFFRRGRCLALRGRGRTAWLSRICPGTGQQEDDQSRQGQCGPSPFQRVDEKRKIKKRMHKAVRVATLQETSADTDNGHVPCRRVYLSKLCSPLLPAAGRPAQARLTISLPKRSPASTPSSAWQSRAAKSRRIAYNRRPGIPRTPSAASAPGAANLQSRLSDYYRPGVPLALLQTLHLEQADGILPVYLRSDLLRQIEAGQELELRYRLARLQVVGPEQ